MRVGDRVTLRDYDGEWEIIDSFYIYGTDYFLVRNTDDKYKYPQMIIDEDLDITCDEADDGFESLY